MKIKAKLLVFSESWLKVMGFQWKLTKLFDCNENCNKVMGFHWKLDSQHHLSKRVIHLLRYMRFLDELINKTLPFKPVYMFRNFPIICWKIRVGSTIQNTVITCIWFRVLFHWNRPELFNFGFIAIKHVKQNLTDMW